ncbi:MAG: hypothetical protein KIT83_19715 [Bryobacterales bacterium]|nr:hypothetical protein [Bryobacterales bacterium]
MQSRRILRIVLVAGFIVLLPFLAMQFTGSVAWDPADFVLLFTLLFLTGLTYEAVVTKSSPLTYRAAVGLALASALLLVLANLAVGLVGSEDNPANRMFFAVPLVGVVGALLARFHAQGMARALIATALTHVLATVIALVLWRPPLGSAEELFGLARVVSGNAFFVALFVASALLFRRTGNVKRLN